MSAKYVALARVSSREQEREGFSLDVQVEALEKYAARNGGTIVKMYRIAETASKKDERKTFKEMLAYVKQNASSLDGLLFYKVDRAARNLFDYVELERLESETGVTVHYVAQPTENSPAGRMQRRILANLASFYTEQQSVDVKEGMERRVKAGLFAGLAPYGYRNIRIDGRSIVQVDDREAGNVQRMYELYASHGHTLDSLIEALKDEGRTFKDSKPEFTRSKVHNILRDRSYIGEVFYRGEWSKGTHAPLVALGTWLRTQVLLGNKVYRDVEATYAAGTMRCSHCGHPITCEVKTKQTKSGERHYVYYRCSQYNTKGHPRARVTETELDRQILGVFRQIRIEDDNVRQWFLKVLRAKAKDVQKTNVQEQERIQTQLTRIRQQQERLLNMRLAEEVDAETFGRKNVELRQESDRLKLLLEVNDKSRAEYGDIAIKAFELSQSLEDKWLTADTRAKRHLLEIVCLNLALDGVNLVPTIRKPFDVLTKGIKEAYGRGDWI